eukprot:TRINITY_DN5817_c0_g1_i1.p1 TRINITY_DN5817_c0_g1~~TRINITY_DN5817_c0_g1_i1.p1  ORF type:complete len:289 (-),score=55.03 TRINITY_DN5817_c0_g1_i1:20-886(-)
MWRKCYHIAILKKESEEIQHSRPVIRTFYDHSAPVNALDFHPSYPVLASASRDQFIRFYDFNSSVKRSYKFMQDTHNVRSFHFHPSGDYLAVSADHPMIRIYDISTETAFVNGNIAQHHLSAVNQVRYTHDGINYASCSKDGTVKLWDGVTNECIHTFTNAHSGREVCTVEFSRNKKYLLTSGKDAWVRLWDLSNMRELRSIYTGSNNNPNWNNRMQVCFSYREDHVFAPDESSNSAIVWDIRTGESVQRLSGHNGVVKYIASSPTDPHVMTCSLDHRARFWVEDTDE